MVLHPTEDRLVERLRVPATDEGRELREDVRAGDGDERAEHEKNSQSGPERMRMPVRRAQSTIQEIPPDVEWSSMFVAAFGSNRHRSDPAKKVNFRPFNGL